VRAGASDWPARGVPPGEGTADSLKSRPASFKRLLGRCLRAMAPGKDDFFALVKGRQDSEIYRRTDLAPEVRRQAESERRRTVGEPDGDEGLRQERHSLAEHRPHAERDHTEAVRSRC